MSDELQHLHDVESILQCDIPVGHSVEEVIYEDARNGRSANETAELIWDGLYDEGVTSVNLHGWSSRRQLRAAS